MANENDYDGGEIKILEGLEAVRKRPGMYIGSTSASGLHHLVWEIVDNSVDEAMAGFCTEIQVTVHADNSITVVDNGRGIPVDEHPIKKIPTLEVVMTILHAGGKFDNSAYKVSGGLHGVGISVVNALSKRVVVQVRRDGNTYEMEFSRGKTVKKMEVVGTSDSTGTTVSFWPDDEIFETCVYDFDTLHNRLQETAFLNKNLKIVLTDEREATPHVEEFCYEGGIIDFVGYMNEGKAITLERILQYGKDAENADFLLFHLGWDKRWGTDAYFGDYPCLDDAAMDYIIAGDYKGIGFDVIGLDPIADENLTRHKKLFAHKDIVNIENLKDLDKCGKGLFSFSCFPLKLENCDGSPIRAVAWFED